MLFDQFGSMIAPGQAPRIWTPSRKIERPGVRIIRRRERPSLEAAIAIVQTSSLVGAAGSTGASTTLGSNTTVGNYLIASSSYFANAGALTVSDNQSNSWSSAIISGSIGGNFNLSSIWYAKVTTAGSTQITWTLPGGSYLSAGAIEVSGLASSSVVDKTASGLGSASASGPPYQFPPVTPIDTGTLSQADELVVLALGSNQLSNDAITTYPSGFTSLFTCQDGGTYQWGEGSYKIVSSTSAIQPVWFTNSGGGSDLYTASVATFKMAGGGSSAATRAGGMVM